MYTPHSAEKIRIGIIGDVDTNEFNEFINEYIFDDIKICKNFSLETVILTDDMIVSDIFHDYNFVFYVTCMKHINHKNTINFVRNVSVSLVDPRNHLFVVITKCDDMKIDEDGDLVYSNDGDTSQFNQLHKTISGFIDSKSFHIFKLDLPLARIYSKIINDSSIVNLLTDEINDLSKKLLSNSDKISSGDKKRELKTVLRKLTLEDELSKTGCTEITETIKTQFKLVNQKKIVCQNYLYYFNAIDMYDIAHVKTFLSEIHDITYLKQSMFDELTSMIHALLDTKIKTICEMHKGHIAFDSKPDIEPYKYYVSITAFLDIANEYDLQSIKLLNHEIDETNKLIINHHNKEIEKLTDLDKIYSLLVIFATKNHATMMGLFEKLSGHSRLMVENMECMPKWITFIDKCKELGVSSDKLINLMEQIIVAKIAFYCDTSKINKNDLSIIYPHCLHIYLLSNLNKHFVFQKLCMMTFYHMRYSGRNILGLIQNLTHDEYDVLLALERKLIELC